MSLYLNSGTKPEDLRVKTCSKSELEFCAQEQPVQIVEVGDYEISIEDFCEMVIYVLTNTDLWNSDDPRLGLVRIIKKLKILKGHGADLSLRFKNDKRLG